MSQFEPVQISNGPLTLEVLPYGVTITAFSLKWGDRCQTHDLVIGPESPAEHQTQKYTNSIANENPRVSLHGGPIAFDAVVWTKIDEPTLFTQAEVEKLKTLDPSAYAIFSLTSEDGDQGYPGKLVSETLIVLVSGAGVPTSAEQALGAVTIVYRAKLEDKKPIQHWGFNLNASLPSHETTIKSHTLNLATDHLVVRDSDNFSSGYAPTSQDAVHNHAGKAIGENYPEAGYDDYLLKKGAADSAPTRISTESFTPELDLVGNIIKPEYTRSIAELASSVSGLKLSFDSNQHGLMVYTNGLSNPSKGARKVAHGGSGVKDKGDSYGPGGEIYHRYHFPAPLHAFLNPEDKDGEDTLLTSDECYHNFVRCTVSAVAK
ncbi:galactose mutarotase-like domain-containing protein [Ephemerocybe angulata]|uniref:Galactose mutarotase-like domain-containing protein n=1 Tax=Ephemerocybe angulata TaxID=980116 RepID=A0A8H6H7G3_9AGAR|nr:galactose mutarotase-like domain-containing protein [Tulosesus angulatus]